MRRKSAPIWSQDATIGRGSPRIVAGWDTGSHRRPDRSLREAHLDRPAVRPPAGAQPAARAAYGVPRAHLLPRAGDGFSCFVVWSRQQESRESPASIMGWNGVDFRARPRGGTRGVNGCEKAGRLSMNRTSLNAFESSPEHDQKVQVSGSVNVVSREVLFPHPLRIQAEYGPPTRTCDTRQT